MLIEHAILVHTCDGTRTRSKHAYSRDVHTREICTESYTHGDHNRVVFACFTDVHTGETSKIGITTNTRKRKIFILLVLALVLI